MAETQTEIDYDKEFEGLKTQSDFWKPQEGKHEIVFLNEPEDTEYIRENGERIAQWKFLIGVGGETKTWTIPKSYTPTSLRGQLIALARKSNKKLSGVKTLIIIQGKGKERRYTVPDAI